MEWNGWKTGSRVCGNGQWRSKGKQKRGVKCSGETAQNGSNGEKGKLRHALIQTIIVLWPRDEYWGWSHARNGKKQVHAKVSHALPLPCPLSPLLPYKQREITDPSLSLLSFHFLDLPCHCLSSFSSLVFSRSILPSYVECTARKTTQCCPTNSL